MSGALLGWSHVAITAISALVGGATGGWLVAYRMGRWRQMVEDRLGVIDARLKRGDGHIGDVPVLKTRVELILDEIRGLKEELRGDRRQFVTHEECDRRHGDGHD